MDEPWVGDADGPHDSLPPPRHPRALPIYYRFEALPWLTWAEPKHVAGGRRARHFTFIDLPRRQNSPLGSPRSCSSSPFHKGGN